MNQEVIINLPIIDSVYNTSTQYTQLDLCLSKYSEYSQAYICISKFQTTMTIASTSASNIQYNNIVIECDNVTDVYTNKTNGIGLSKILDSFTGQILSTNSTIVFDCSNNYDNWIPIGKQALNSISFIVYTSKPTPTNIYFMNIKIKLIK